MTDQFDSLLPEEQVEEMTPPVAALPGEAVQLAIAIVEAIRPVVQAIDWSEPHGRESVVVQMVARLLTPSAPRAETERTTNEAARRVANWARHKIVEGTLRADSRIVRDLDLLIVHAAPGERAREKGVEHGD